MEEHPDLRVARAAASGLHRTLQACKTNRRQASDTIRELAQIRDASTGMTPQQMLDAAERIARDARRDCYAISKRLLGVIAEIERTNAQPTEARHDTTHHAAA